MILKFTHFFINYFFFLKKKKKHKSGPAVRARLMVVCL